VLPALVLAEGPSRVELEGGTHNPFAPPFDFLARVFLPLLGRMGPRLDAELRRYGFYPAGGGQMAVEIEPARGRLEPIELVERGRVERVSAEVLVANLPAHIGERETRVLSRRLKLDPTRVRVGLLGKANSSGPGNVAMVRVESEHLTELFSEFGVKGVPAERVATRLAERVERYLAAPVAVGQRLADQLLLPLALAGGGRFTTLPPSRHTLTNVQVIRQLLPDVSIDLTEIGADSWLVSVGCDGGAERQGEK
jgi:RNA 3'-terminal phosphate cyclase (ATP)